MPSVLVATFGHAWKEGEVDKVLHWSEEVDEVDEVDEGHKKKDDGGDDGNSDDGNSDDGARSGRRTSARRRVRRD